MYVCIYTNHFRSRTTLIMSAVFYLGSMFSGKTNAILSQIERARYAEQSCVLIKYVKDTRYSEGNVICTHNDRKVESEPADDIFGSLRVVKAESLCKVEILDHEKYIGIDEGQFYPDLREAIFGWLRQGKRIYVAALSGDFKCKSFPAVLESLPLATSIVHLKAVCMVCKSNDHNPVDAQYTIRTTENKKIEVIGANDIYKAACVDCMIKHHS
jgi:thymidine kinase